MTITTRSERGSVKDAQHLDDLISKAAHLVLTFPSKYTHNNQVRYHM